MIATRRTSRRHRTSTWFLPLLILLTAQAPLCGCAGPSLAPTPNLYWATGENPFDDVPDVFRSPDVEMLYATDRKPSDTDDGRVEYGYGRSHSLAMGLCTVRMGEDLTWDELVEASTVKDRRRSVPLAVTNIEEVVRLPPSNTTAILVDGVRQDRPEFLAAQAEADDRFQDLVRERLAMTPVKDVYVFVHGFNNSFEAAAYRMASLWHFLGRQGVPLFYSWPAGHPGLLKGYNYDRESSEFTVFHLKHLCRQLSQCPEVERIHIVGHSRGTDVVLTTIRELWIEMRSSGRTVPRKLGNLIIAAADIDWEVLQQRVIAERMPHLIDAWVYYLSDEDKAIGLSSWLFGSLARVGRLGIGDLSPEQRDLATRGDELQVIDVEVNSGFLGHGYFIDNPAVLSDLILVLRDGKRIGAENGRPLTPREGGFWTIDDEYLVGD